MSRRAEDRWASEEEAPALLKKRRASMRRQQRAIFDGRAERRRDLRSARQVRA